MGLPQKSFILVGLPSSYWGTPMTMETPICGHAGDAQAHGRAGLDRHGTRSRGPSEVPWRGPRAAAARGSLQRERMCF